MVASASNVSAYAKVAPGNSNGLVFNIMRFSLRDGPGIRTTVFLKGCPLRCTWCHNPESQSVEQEVMFAAENCLRCGDCVRACSHGAISWQDGPVRNSKLCAACGNCVEACVAQARRLVGEWITVKQLIARLRRDEVFFGESGGGVTFSGGEPMMQRDFLRESLRACKAAGMHTAVDTSGFAPTEFVEQIADDVDLFLFDLKLVDRNRHRQHTGVDNSVILKNLALLVNRGRNVLVRIPVIPGVNDDQENILASKGLLTQIKVKKLELLPYHQIGIEKYRRLGKVCELVGVEAPSMERMQALSNEFRREGFAVRIGV